MLQVSSKNNLYFNIFDYFQYEKFIQIHVGGIILYIKKLVRTLRCLMRTKYEEGRIQNVDDFKEVLNNVLSNR